MNDQKLLKMLEFKFISKNQRIRDLEQQVKQLQEKKQLVEQEKKSS